MGRQRRERTREEAAKKPAAARHWQVLRRRKQPEACLWLGQWHRLGKALRRCEALKLENEPEAVTVGGNDVVPCLGRS